MSAILEPVLSIQGLTHRYGQVPVLNALNWRINTSERWWLSGANGAGKTTLLNLIAGDLSVQQGHLKFYGRDITRISNAERSRAGLSRSFQLPQLFDSLTVAEHWRAVGVLQHRDLRKPQELSYAERKRLDVELTLARQAHLFLLDEPTAGLSYQEARDFYQILAQRFSTGTFIIIEHDSARIKNFATHAASLKNGILELGS
jgi:branched-chain amino acid transport system ATP-binding protein